MGEIKRRKKALSGNEDTSGFHTRRFECGHMLQVATLVVQSYELGN
jgi:hypothetical protein